MTEVQEPRYSVRTDLKPADQDRAAAHLATTHHGTVSETTFRELFPQGCFQDALCHEGTNPDGRAHTYYADDVLESERDPKTGPSHQAIFAAVLLRLEDQPALSTDELRARARAKSVADIPAMALSFLLTTVDGGWEPTEYICNDIAAIAHRGGVRSTDLLAPPCP